jgi:hypothetical protein
LLLLQLSRTWRRHPLLFQVLLLLLLLLLFLLLLGLAQSVLLPALTACQQHLSPPAGHRQAAL